MGRLPYRSRALGTVMALPPEEIIGSVGAGDAFCAACCTAATNAGR